MILLLALLACDEPVVIDLPDDLAARVVPPIEPPPAPVPCDGQDFAVVTRGAVYLPDGVPVPNAVIGGLRPDDPFTPDPIARTDGNGSYKVEIAQPTAVRPVAVPAEPETFCVGIPKEFTVHPPPDGGRIRMNIGNVNFIVPSACTSTLTLELPTDAQGPVEVLAASAAGEVLRVDRIDDLSAPHAVALPCDTRAVGLLGAHLSSAPRTDPAACDAPAWMTCTPPGGADLTLPLVGVRTVTLTARNPDGSAPAGLHLTGDLGPRLFPDDGALTIGVPPAAIQVAVPDSTYLPSRVTVGDDDADARIDLVPARALPVRCAGARDDRCPTLPTVEVDGDPVLTAHSCAWGADGHVWCRAPSDRPALLRLPGRAVRIPPDAAAGWIDLRDLGGALLGTVSPGCHAVATRTASMLPGPRVPVQATFGVCDDAGALHLGPLSAGQWTVSLRAGGQAWSVTADVDNLPVDLGQLTPP